MFWFSLFSLDTVAAFGRVICTFIILYPSFEGCQPQCACVAMIAAKRLGARWQWVDQSRYHLNHRCILRILSGYQQVEPFNILMLPKSGFREESVNPAESYLVVFVPEAVVFIGMQALRSTTLRSPERISCFLKSIL